MNTTKVQKCRVISYVCSSWESPYCFCRGKLYHFLDKVWLPWNRTLLGSLYKWEPISYVLKWPAHLLVLYHLLQNNGYWLVRLCNTVLHSKDSTAHGKFRFNENVLFQVKKIKIQACVLTKNLIRFTYHKTLAHALWIALDNFESKISETYLNFFFFWKNAQNLTNIPKKFCTLLFKKSPLCFDRYLIVDMVGNQKHGSRMY